MTKPALILLATLIGGCGDSMATPDYNAHEITLASATIEAESLNISYRTPLESLYFSPGIKVETVAGNTTLTIVRCNINSQCDTDVKAALNQGVYSATVTMANASDLNSVFIADTNGPVSLQTLLNASTD